MREIFLERPANVVQALFARMLSTSMNAAESGAVAGQQQSAHSHSVISESWCVAAQYLVSEAIVLHNMVETCRRNTRKFNYIVWSLRHIEII